jgi:hypothetical protein
VTICGDPAARTISSARQAGAALKMLGCAQRVVILRSLWTTLSGFESLPPSQFSFHTTNDCAAGVCSCFDAVIDVSLRRTRAPSSATSTLRSTSASDWSSNPEKHLPRDGTMGAALRTAKELIIPACLPPHLVIEGTTGSPDNGRTLNAANRSTRVTPRHDASIDH